MRDIAREDLDDLIEALRQANLVHEVYDRTAEILQEERYADWVQRSASNVRRYRSRVGADPGVSADH